MRVYQFSGFISYDRNSGDYFVRNLGYLWSTLEIEEGHGGVEHTNVRVFEEILTYIAD